MRKVSRGPGARAEERMPSILVVDDDEGLLPALVDAFGAQGYRAEGAQSASEALEKLERAAFDVLLTDLMMPGMDGVALLERVRARFPEMVMILMTWIRYPGKAWNIILICSLMLI